MDICIFRCLLIHTVPNDCVSSLCWLIKQELPIILFFQDIHFIIDTAECIIRTVQDESLLVRMKAAWSLGNLSEALVLNSYV